jgi:hypothetical protein
LTGIQLFSIARMRYNCPFTTNLSLLITLNQQEGKIEGMHVPYDTIRRVDVSSSGTVVVEMSSPPQCHESLQVAPNNSAIKMTVIIAQNDVEHFIRTLRTRGIVWCYGL